MSADCHREELRRTRATKRSGTRWLRAILDDERPRHDSVGGAMADINLTPLIDVLLVLLIIFMVAVPITQRSIEAAIPEKRPDTDRTTTPPPALPLLEVRADIFQLGSEVYSSIDELEKGLTARLSTRNDRAVIVKADGAVDYGRVIEAMDAARGAGATRIGMLPAEDGGAR
jgi:biopolymer transport protein TolR